MSASGCWLKDDASSVSSSAIAALRPAITSTSALVVAPERSRDRSGCS